jgi:hypothetical protein
MESNKESSSSVVSGLKFEEQQEYNIIISKINSIAVSEEVVDDNNDDTH